MTSGMRKFTNGLNSASVAAFSAKRVGVTSIQSVTWEAVSNGAELTNNPASNSGGVRIFPEKDLDGTLKNKVKIRVQLAREVPDGMTGTVHLKVLDPWNQCKDAQDNAVGTLAWFGSQTDNHGSVYFATQTFQFDGNTNPLITTDIIQNGTFIFDQANAGDNFIVIAMPDNTSCNAISIQTAALPNALNPDDPPVLDYKTPAFNASSVASISLDTCHQTPLLTVWRTLWLEVDRLKIENTTIVAPNLELVLEPDENGYKDSIADELDRGCVCVSYIPENLNLKKIITVSQKVIDHINTYDTIHSQRDCAMNSKFWSFQIIMAFSRSGSTPTAQILGNYYNNTICIFNDEFVSNGGKNLTLLHEILHGFGYSHDTEEDVLMASKDANDIRLLDRYIRCIQSSSQPLYYGTNS